MEFFATAGGIPVHILDTKKGESTILLLHGYLETMYIWSEFIDALRGKYRVIAIDMPGHGLTDSAPASEEEEQVNTMEFMAAVARDVLRVCNVEKAAVGGHSMGGFVALRCAALYPETFDKLILFNSNPFKDSEAKAEDRRREIAIISSGKLTTLAAASIPRMYNQENLRKFDDKIMETVELCETHDPQGIVACVKGMAARSDMQDFLLETKMPAMLIAGDSDSFLSMESVNIMREKFRSLKIVVLPSTGHNSFVENTQETCRQVCEFLG